MKVCPTEAIRLRNGKSTIYEHRCIDCGECYKVCPVSAIYIEQDDFKRIYDYKYRIALVPAVFIGQFPENYTPQHIYSALHDLGFTHVYEVELGVEILIEAINRYMQKNENSINIVKPIISSFCPAIIRLIQVKFPTLVENIMQLKAPLDIAAMYCKKQFADVGVASNEVGLFYITPCAAKIAAVKSPVGEDKSLIDGVINMDFIYNKVYKKLKEKNVDKCTVPDKRQISPRGMLWALTNGESNIFEGRCLAIDGINNVVDFLEKVENEEITGVDYLELRACDQSCAGGVLSSGNRFLTIEHLHNISEKLKKNDEKEKINTRLKDLIANKQYLMDNIQTKKIMPRSMLKLDENMSIAIKKMTRIREIMDQLPRVDCGVCGAPTCSALAEDIVQKNGEIEQCIFIQRIQEQLLELDSEQSIEIMKKVWGDKKLNPNTFKKGHL